MTRTILALCIATSAVALGGGYGITWQPVGGVYSGSYTNDLYWDSNDGTWPGQDSSFETKFAPNAAQRGTANANAAQTAARTCFIFSFSIAVSRADAFRTPAEWI